MFKYIYRSDAFIAGMYQYAENYKYLAGSHGWERYKYPSGFGWGWKLKVNV
jgi:hypothetical protein